MLNILLVLVVAFLVSGSAVKNSPRSNARTTREEIIAQPLRKNVILQDVSTSFIKEIATELFELV